MNGKNKVKRTKKWKKVVKVDTKTTEGPKEKSKSKNAKKHHKSKSKK